MKSFVTTVVGGMIGIAALYVVGKIAFQAGHDMGEMECRYRAMEKKVQSPVPNDEDNDAQETMGADEPEESDTEADAILEEESKKQSKLGLLWGVRRMVGGGKKESVLGKLIHHPEAHRIEAFVQGGELHVNVKPRTA